MHTISQEYLIKLPIGYSVFLLLLQLLFFHLNLSLNSLFRFTFSLFCLTLGLFKENKRLWAQDAVFDVGNWFN